METLKRLLHAIFNYSMKDLDNLSVHQWGMIKYFHKHDLSGRMVDYLKETIADNRRGDTQ